MLLPSRTALSTQSLLATAFAILLAASSSEAQEVEASLKASEIFTAANTRRFLGMTGDDFSCNKCHNRDKAASPGAFFFTLENEMRIWHGRDKHSDAFKVLENELSQSIAAKLAKTGEQSVPAHRDKRCLVCHTGIPAHQMEPADSLAISTEYLESAPVRDGVSCESCHGPSGNSDAEQPILGWRGLHVGGPNPSILLDGKPQAWRYMKREEKLSRFGYYDVRTTSTKTKLCLSCHLGNVEQGKIVTHDMFAAGHPPLPGFELATFVSQQPRHWRRFEEKDEKELAKYLSKLAEKDADPNTIHDAQGLGRTKEMLVSALVVASESLALAADLAGAETTPPEPLAKPQWPELAQFACFNCHHDLKRSSWRQSRGYRLKPGRPDLHEWPDLLTRLSLAFIGVKSADLDQQLQPIVAELNQTPFGRSATFSSSAGAAAQWLDNKARSIETRRVTSKDGKKLLSELRNIVNSRRSLDYHSARQAVWAAGVLYDDLTGRKTNPREIRPWYRDATNPGAKSLASFRSSLSVFLRESRENPDLKVAIPDESGQSLLKRSLSEFDYQARLTNVSNYDPATFLKSFSALLDSFETLAVETKPQD